MGLLDQVLGQVLGGGQSAPTSQDGAGAGGLAGMLSGNKGQIAMALLALLASKQGGSGSGGYGSVLSSMLGGGQQPGLGGAGGAQPNILGQLGSLLGGGGPSTSGGLGSLLGGSLTGGALAGGLGDLLGRFAQNGHGAIANSWVGNGPNAPVTPDQLNQVIGTDNVDELSRQTGLGRGDLLSQLSGVLPQVVDRLTPNGRLPTEDEHSQWI